MKEKSSIFKIIYTSLTLYIQSTLKLFVFKNIRIFNIKWVASRIFFSIYLYFSDLTIVLAPVQVEVFPIRHQQLHVKHQKYGITIAKFVEHQINKDDNVKA